MEHHIAFALKYQRKVSFYIVFYMAAMMYQTDFLINWKAAQKYRSSRMVQFISLFGAVFHITGVDADMFFQ